MIPCTDIWLKTSEYLRPIDIVKLNNAFLIGPYLFTRILKENFNSETEKPNYEFYSKKECWLELCQECSPSSFSGKLCCDHSREFVNDYLKTSEFVRGRYFRFNPSPLLDWLHPRNCFDTNLPTSKSGFAIHSRNIMDWYENGIKEGFSKKELFYHLQGRCMIKNLIFQGFDIIFGFPKELRSCWTCNCNRSPSCITFSCKKCCSDVNCSIHCKKCSYRKCSIHYQY
jgi:hypothetical protein